MIQTSSYLYAFWILFDNKYDLLRSLIGATQYRGGEVVVKSEMSVRRNGVG